MMARISSPGRTFIPSRSPYLGRTPRFGTGQRQQRSLVLSGEKRDETSLRYGHVRRFRHRLPIRAALPSGWRTRFSPSATRPSAGPRRCRPRTSRSSPCRMRARRNGTGPTPPGSGSNFCSASMRRATGPSTPTSPSCSIPITSAPAPVMPAIIAATSPVPAPIEVGAYRSHVDAAVVKFFRETGEDKLRGSHRWSRSGSTTSSSIRN